MNDSNETSNVLSEENHSTVGRKRRLCPQRIASKRQLTSRRRDANTRRNSENNETQGVSTSMPVLSLDGILTHSSGDSIPSEANCDSVNETDIQTNITIDSTETVVAVSTVSPNLTIDLTEEDSVIDDNIVESDSEVEIISSSVRDEDLCIVRETKCRTNRPDRTDRSRPQSGQSDDIIEITNTQTKSDREVEKTVESSSRKAIKCPVCLDEYSSFQVSGRQLVSTNCGHLFCDRCIKEVIKTSKTCPNCRKRITTQKSFHAIYL